MQDEGSRTIAEYDDAIDRTLMALLLDDGSQLWSLDELARIFGDPVEAQDAVQHLARAGLLHRLEGFVFVTEPARRAFELLG
jgi:hypothetical protein